MAFPKQVRITNNLAYAFSVMMLFWFILAATIFRDPWIAGMDLAFALAFLSVTKLNARGWSHTGRLALVTFINATFYVFPTLFGPQAGIHYCFLPAAALPFLIFETQERRSIAFGVLLPILLFTLLLQSNFTLFSQYERTSDPDWVFWVTLGCAFILSVLPAWLSSRASEQAERKYSNIVELAQDGIWVIDGEGKTTYANPAMETMMGYPREGMIGKPLLDFVSSIDSLTALDGLERRTTVSTERFEFPLRRRDGKRMQTLVSASPIRDASGKMHSAVVLVMDVTDSKAKEKLLEDQRAKMLSTAKLSSLGEMAGGISHEINNPLTAISLKIGLLESMAAKGPTSPEDLRKAANQMKAVVKRITTIIDGLKSFSRDDSSAPLREVPVRSVIEDTLSFCRERFRIHGIELAVAEVPDALRLRCRPVQISQVLLNLLNNAFDAVAHEQTKRIAIEVREEGGELEIAVLDSGHGVSEAEAERIFEPFFTTKPVGQGTGLGLSVSKGIIEAHRGALYFGSGAGRGARFAFKLPKA